MLYDNNPERRNLMVMSFVIIVYFFGEGSLGDELKLSIINVKFENHMFFSCGVIVLLFWFLLRYWQVSKGEISSKIKNNIITNCRLKFVYYYARLSLGKKYMDSHEIRINNIIFKKWYLVIIYSENFIKKNNGGVTREQGKTHCELDIKGVKGFIVYLRFTFVIVFKEPDFNKIIVPYLLSFIALYTNGT